MGVGSGEGTRKKTCGLREARAHWPTLCDAREVEEGLEVGGGMKAGSYSKRALRK